MITADYWKSQDRKYCDFCKCWIADNKPSVEFHEKGKRHQENVKKKIKSIQRNSAKSQKETEKFESTLKQIESAALDAYRRDVEQNRDLTSIAINKKVQDDNLSIACSSTSKKVWKELKSNEGKTYYWNVLTNESVWEPPKEGYLSIQEQKDEEAAERLKQFRAFQKETKAQEMLRLQEQKQFEEEERARLAREKLKERRVIDDLPPVVCGPLLPEGKNDPYGQWQTVKAVEHVDLQLPQQEYFEQPILAEPEPVVKEFKEKVIGSIEGSETGFKKRKMGSASKRNTRQRLDDD